MYNLVCVERIESILGIIFSSLMLHEDQMQDDDADAADDEPTMSQKEKQPPRIESLKTVIVWYLPVVMGIRALKSSVHIKYRVMDFIPVFLVLIRQIEP